MVEQTYRRIRVLAGELKRNAPRLLKMSPRVAVVTLQKALGRSDYKRWANPDSLEKWWESRTQKMAGFIPASSRVVEFGAGRCRLRDYLDPGSTYFASDLVPRTPDTIVCDLNQRPLPDLRYLHADVTVFAGVLEYISDLPTLVAWLARQTSMAIVSYDDVKSPGGTAAGAAELFRRSNSGYLNHYTVVELETVFSAAGFRCVLKDAWQAQKILVFAEARSAPIAGSA